MCKLNTKMLI